MTTETTNQSVADRIRQCMAENPTMKAKDIATKVGCNLQYVYLLKKKAKKAAAKTTKPAKPAKTRVVAVQPDKVPTAWFEEQGRAVRELRKEIDELTVIIAYLEHRCARAEAGRGASI